MSTSTNKVEIDALALAQALIRRPSVTPKDAGALDVLEAVLKELGFVTHRLPFGEVDNLYAPHFCFAAIVMWCRSAMAGTPIPLRRKSRTGGFMAGALPI
jgi:hypothetical protein